MLVESNEIRSFISNYSNKGDLDKDLNSLVLEFKRTKDSRQFATIYDKVLGTFLKYGRMYGKNINQEDVYSIAMESLYNSVREQNGWNPNKCTSFLTYITRIAHNAILKYENKKSYRDFPKYCCSLDELLDDEENDFQVSEEQGKLKFYRKVIYDKDDIKMAVEEIQTSPIRKMAICEELELNLQQLDMYLLKIKNKHKVINDNEKKTLKSLLAKYRRHKKQEAKRKLVTQEI